MPTRNWLAVASADRVRIGRANGFMQVCHGKAAPLRRLRPDDWVIYYSPSTAFRGKDRLQSLTAIGRVATGDPYTFDMGNGFIPWRRDVRWLTAREHPIAPLLKRLDLTADRQHWGYQLRYGLIEIGERDRQIIADAMAAE
ncbi:MAG: EVE domain-containing protein [Acidobacteriaceae bacterium]|jgi:hypothetical protein|nr:EVE domain-containing protein [Acidobacteriaceae bacterium]